MADAGSDAGVIGACIGGTPLPGYVRFCYVADTNKALGKVGPFELQFEADPPGAAEHDCWMKSPNYGTPACNLCPDINPDDSVLECDLPFPSGTSNFEFTVYKPGDFWWGDQSDDPLGGCGQDNGTVTLTTSSGNLVYARKDNLAGPEYKNGLVVSVP